MDIITYLLNIIQEQYQQICWLILFICRYIPLKQWAHEEIQVPEIPRRQVTHHQTLYQTGLAALE